MTWKSEQKILVSGNGEAPGYRSHCVSQYDGGIAYVDHQIGEVVTWLKRRGAYDNTMIVVTSDHGEAFGERHRVGHANSPYQNLLHVALIVKYPHQARRGTEERPVSLTRRCADDPGGGGHRRAANHAGPQPDGGRGPRDL